jgi:hypothetical protein
MFENQVLPHPHPFLRTRLDHPKQMKFFVMGYLSIFGSGKRISFEFRRTTYVSALESEY